MIKKSYRIDVNGCDDSTSIFYMLSKKEYDLVNDIAERITNKSTYQCMPTMFVYEEEENND
jgi:hypothetical protein